MPKPNRPLLKKPPNKIPPKNRKKQPSPLWFWVILSLLVLTFFSGDPNSFNQFSNVKKLSYSEFYHLLNNQPETIEKIVLKEGEEYLLEGTLTDKSLFSLQIPKSDDSIIALIRNSINDFSVKPAHGPFIRILQSIFPFVLLLLLFWFISYRGSQMGNKIWSFGKSRARVSNKNSGKITFRDVAGVDEAKEELQEIIEFLKDPRKFQRLGGKIPKGVLLVGLPGTGKTLLAKAVAGEADVPFFSLSGSDFVEMFVGVGASRVRDLFEQARKAAKLSMKGAIVFIDEIDAVGRQRFSGIGGGNDEREQTLNALLVEMDGFNPQIGVIVIAATNRPDTLDPALLRPGRFDRQIVVALPDILGREGILKVHTKNLKLANNIDFKKLAQQTVYFSGADLANACNEAALLAARKNKEAVEMEDFISAIERVTMGPEKKSRTISRKEKEMTAYHEAGHALLSLLIDEVDTFSKISIIPRGMAGGYTLTPPKEDKHYRNKKELKGIMAVLLGGLVAEELHVGDTSTGVSNDLEKVTMIARSMVCEYGMSDKLGRMAYGRNQRQHFLGRDLLDHQKDYSEETAKHIDAEVQKFVNEVYQRAKDLLSGNREKLDLIAKTLIEKEVIDIQETRALLGMSPETADVNETGSSSPGESPKKDPDPVNPT